MVQPNCVLGVYKVTSSTVWWGLPICCPGKQVRKHLVNSTIVNFEYFRFQPRFDSKPSELAPYGIAAQVEELMQKINAIFVKYGYPIFPLFPILPFIYFSGYFVLDISSSLPDWYINFWFGLFLAVWHVIFVITKIYCAYMKPKRIRQEIKTFNTSFNSTGMIFCGIRTLDSLIEFQEYQWILTNIRKV